MLDSSQMMYMPLKAPRMYIGHINDYNFQVYLTDSGQVTHQRGVALTRKITKQPLKTTILKKVITHSDFKEYS